MKRSARTKSRPVGPLVGADLVACIDGPLDGHWYHRADWTNRRDAARNMGHDETSRPGASLAYIEDRGVALIDHPHDAGVIGHAARWALGPPTRTRRTRR